MKQRSNSVTAICVKRKAMTNSLEWKERYRCECLLVCLEKIDENFKFELQSNRTGIPIFDNRNHSIILINKNIVLHWLCIRCQSKRDLFGLKIGPSLHLRCDCMPAIGAKFVIKSKSKAFPIWNKLHPFWPNRKTSHYITVLRFIYQCVCRITSTWDEAHLHCLAIICWLQRGLHFPVKGPRWW